MKSKKQKVAKKKTMVPSKKASAYNAQLLKNVRKLSDRQYEAKIKKSVLSKG